MAYKTGKKCFFCNEDTLSQQKIGKKTICSNCIIDLYNVLDLKKYEKMTEPIRKENPFAIYRSSDLHD